MARKIPQVAIISLGLVLILIIEPAKGKIECYQDGQGVWRVQNLPAAAKKEPSVGLEPGGAVQPTSPASTTAKAPATPSTIQCVIDARGVISITNLKASAGEGPQAVKDRALALPPAKLAVAPANRLQRYGKTYLVKNRQGKYLVYNINEQEEKEKQDLRVASDSELEPLIDQAARRHQLEPSLIRAVIKAESNFNTAARSPKGAIGLMQLMPETADFLGLKNPRCPVENINGGSRYLRLLLDCFHGDLELALAAYNAGFQRVIQAGFQVPGIKETEDFVKRVLRYFREYRSQNQHL